jgi:hypothetical protein
MKLCVAGIVTRLPHILQNQAELSKLKNTYAYSGCVHNFDYGNIFIIAKIIFLPVRIPAASGPPPCTL